MRHLAFLLSVLCLAACASILGIKAPDASRPFEHRAHALKGVNCLQCHEGVQSAGDDDPLHLPGTRKCTSCHDKPHDTRTCSECHGSSHNRATDDLARKHLRFDHGKHTAKLGGQCTSCHAAKEVGQVTMRPAMAQCFGCHAHEDQWRTRDCDGCHVDLPKEAITPESHVVHEGNFVREHGVRAASARDLCATCHSERFCASCHGVTVPVLPWRLAFDRPSMTGLHRAGFRERHADEARAAPGTCTSCHASARFCTDCHGEKSVGAGQGRNPHPAGWVMAKGGGHGREARLDPGSCAGCHGGQGEMLCVGCHRVGAPGGNPHGRGFASALDKVRDTPCKECHAR